MSSSTPTTLSAAGITKKFGDLRALGDVSLTVRPGRVHALLGENGAGKSTLTKIFAGMQQPTDGRLLLDGSEVTLTSREQALAHGIGLVPQHLSLNRDMTLLDNFLLTQHERVLRRRAGLQRLRATIDEAGFGIDPTRRVRSMSLAERQFGELAIALAGGARVLLLDEPTSALGPFETQGLFERVRALAEQGTAVLLITHRIDEVRAIADDLTVLRGGRVELTGEVQAHTDAQIVRALVGESAPVDRPGDRVAGDVVLALREVSTRTGDRTDLDRVSLEVRAGQIVGVLGVAGNGQGDLTAVSGGLTTPSAGRVLLGGTDISGRAGLARTRGLRLVTEERAEDVLPDAPAYVSASVLEITKLPALGRIRRSRLVAYARALMDARDVRPREPYQLTGAFSGGNQQKLLVGRELDGEPRAIVLHGPTQGLDIHAAAAIRRGILSAAERGAAVLLISSDVDEVRELADHVVVLAKGRVSDRFAIAEFDHDRLGRAMSGLASEGIA